MRNSVFHFFNNIAEQNVTHKRVALNELKAKWVALRPEVSQCVYFVKLYFILENKRAQFSRRWKQSQFIGQEKAVRSPNWPFSVFLKLNFFLYT